VAESTVVSLAGNKLILPTRLQGWQQLVSMTDKASVIRSANTQDEEDQGEEGNDELHVLFFDFQHTCENLGKL